MGRKDDDRDPAVRDISAEAVIQILADRDAPVATATVVGEMVGCSVADARRKLLELRARGIVARRHIGSGTTVWWLVSDVSTAKDAQEFDGDHPLFSGAPLLAPDDPIDETEIDAILYAGD